MSSTYRLKTTFKFLAGVAALALSVIFCHSPWGKAWDRFSLDLFFYLRGTEPLPSEIVVTAIDEASFGLLQKQWPWPRSLHARLIETLFAAGARLIAFDIIFAEPSTPQEDERLKEALLANPHVILAGDFHVVKEANYTQEILVGPNPEVFPPEIATGFVNLPVDPDGFVRRTRLHHGGVPSLPLMAKILYCGQKECDGLVTKMSLSKDEYEINFLGPPRSVTIVSYYQALDPEFHLPENFFKGKAVFVGLVTGTTIEGRSRGVENFPMPFSRWNGGYMAGVEIHAHVFHNLLTNRLIRNIAEHWQLLMSIVMGSLATVISFRLKPGPASLLVLVQTAVGIWVTYWLFVARFIHVPFPSLVLPALLCYLSSPFLHYWEVWREKNFVRKAFSKYLSPTVVAELVNHPEELRLGGRRMQATVLFLDVAGFTTLSEKTAPEALIQVMNRYLGVFTEIVFRWNGMVDKFMGDAVMATWGAPAFQADHAVWACQAALEMREAVSDPQRQEERTGSQGPLRIRIGINSGDMVAGNVGGERHFNYTVLGDEVNLASRLEGVNRYYGTVITIGQNTASLVSHEFELRELDFVRVRGKEEPVRIYELQGIKGSLNDTQIQVNAAFKKGRSLYEQCNWEKAMEHFEEALSLNGNDGPSRTYMERCQLFRERPPGQGWDCAFRLNH